MEPRFGEAVTRAEGGAHPSAVMRLAARSGHWLRRAGTLGAASVLAAFVVVPAIFFLRPVPAGADAVTLCMPGLGPLQQFARDLDGDLEEVVLVHEETHARQCRALGAAEWMVRYGTLRGRMELEAEAFCAEVELLAARGADRERLIEPRVEVLYEGYRNDGTLSMAQVREIVRAACVPGGVGGRSAGRGAPRTAAR